MKNDGVKLSPVRVTFRSKPRKAHRYSLFETASTEAEAKRPKGLPTNYNGRRLAAYMLTRS